MNGLKPLAVDLDGTLIKTDLMFESVVLLIKRNPLYIFIIPFWILKGRYYLKTRLLELVRPDMTIIPVNMDVLNFVMKEKAKNRRIILITASMQSLADEFASYYNCFDEVIGSKNGINLVGHAKAKYLKDRFGEKGFDYIGDNHKDFYIWQYADISHLVNQKNEMINKVGKVSEVGMVWNFHSRNKIKIVLKELRIYQWVKNLLVFLPALLAHNLEIDIYLKSIIAFFAFSLSASAIYVANDLIDIESDRSHQTKRNRPLASGELDIPSSVAIMFILLLLSLTISLVLLPFNFLPVILLYLIITTLYSFLLKRLPIFDIITLALLYTLRLIAGSSATGVPISEWLSGFSLFFFLSMGALKRFTELKILLTLNKTKAKGRSYYVEDLQIIQIFGISSGLISVLVLVLFINSTTISNLYDNPFLLYLIIPLILYWVLRVWFLAHRGEFNEDPILFAVKDKWSYLIGLITLLIAISATI